MASLHHTDRVHHAPPYSISRRRRKMHWGHPPIITALIATTCTLSPPLIHAAATAEYVKSQHPTEVDLKGSHSATESIGTIPGSLADQYEPFSLMPGHLLPKWRKELWPKTNQPFFDDVQFSIHPRFHYIHRDTFRKGIQESAAIGGSLGVETGWLNEILRFGLTAYTSQKLYGPSDRDGIGLLAEGQHGYSVLGEAYVDLKHSNSLFRAGRTRVDLPFINAWDFRMTPWTFEAVGFRIQEIDHLKISFGHFFRIKQNTSTDFETMSAVAGVDGVDRGVSAIALRYEFSDDNFIALTNQYGWDMFNTLYLEGEYLFEISDHWKARVGAQFIDQHSVGDELLGDFNTQSMGMKLSLQYCNLITDLSYTWTGNGADVVKPWGGTPAYNSSMIEDFDRAGEQSFRIGASYDFAVHGLEGVSADAGWIVGDTPDSGSHASSDQKEFNGTINYQPAIEMFDGVWFRVRYANTSRDDGSRIEDIRMDLNYSYTF